MRESVEELGHQVDELRQLVSQLTFQVGELVSRVEGLEGEKRGQVQYLEDGMNFEFELEQVRDRLDDVESWRGL